MYKIVLSNTKDTIPVSKDDLPKVLKMISDGNKVIITKEGVFNPSYMVAIVYDSARSQIEAEHKELGMPERTSEFAYLLGDKMKKLN
jgi:hypothetical protein